MRASAAGRRQAGTDGRRSSRRGSVSGEVTRHPPAIASVAYGRREVMFQAGKSLPRACVVAALRARC